MISVLVLGVCLVVFVGVFLGVLVVLQRDQMQHLRDADDRTAATVATITKAVTDAVTVAVTEATRAVTGPVSPTVSPESRGVVMAGSPHRLDGDSLDYSDPTDEYIVDPRPDIAGGKLPDYWDQARAQAFGIGAGGEI